MDLRELKRDYPFHLLTGAILAGMLVFAIARAVL